MKIFFTIIWVVLFSLVSSAQVEDSLSWMQQRKINNAKKIEEGRMLVLPLAESAYTPEMGFTVLGGVMLSYKTNWFDSLIQRLSSPIMFG